MRRLVCLALFLSVPAYGQSASQSSKSLTPISLSVESETATSSPIQVGEDIGQSEITDLDSLISAKLKKSHRLVPETFGQNHIFLSVVVTKFVANGRKTFYAASIAMNFGELNGHIDYINHNVILQQNLDGLANAVVLAVVAIELRGMFGTLK